MFAEWIDSVFTTTELLWIVLAAFCVGGISFLWFVNKDEHVRASVLDLITTDGRLNERKLTRFGAWVVSTWGFVYLIGADKLTEWYFVGYMGAWVANALIGKAIRPVKSDDTQVQKD